MAGVAVVTGGAVSLVTTPKPVDADGEEVTIELPEQVLKTAGLDIRLVEDRLVATNTTGEDASATVRVSAMSEQGEPMGRMAMMPVTVWSEDLVVNVPAGGTTEIALDKRIKKDFGYLVAQVDDQSISTVAWAAMTPLGVRNTDAQVNVNANVEPVDVARVDN